MSRTSKYFYVERDGLQVQVAAADGLLPATQGIGANFTLDAGHVGVRMSAKAARSLAAALTLAADHYESESADEREVA